MVRPTRAWSLVLVLLSLTGRASLVTASTCPGEAYAKTAYDGGCAWVPVVPDSAASLGGSTTEQEEKQQAAAAIFFGQIDGDGDGQIGAEEARSYVAGLSGEEFDTTEEVSRAVQDMMGDLDGSDIDTSISLAEFMAHTHVMLQGSRVSDWIEHGLELPQYAAKFRENAITIGDFPLLAGASGPTILQEDLNVTSRLHRDRIVRSIKQLMLGLGHAPSPPQAVSCEAVKCRIIVNWKPPSSLGGPHFHKYVIERRIMNVEGWTTVGETNADDTQFVLGATLEGGKYEFRVTAWNSAGRSLHGVSDVCLLSEMQCTAGLNRDRHASFSAAEETLLHADSSGSSAVSFWVWVNSGISAAAYIAVILIKHTAQDPSFRGRLKQRIAEFAPIRLMATFANRSRELEEWAHPSRRRIFSKLEHSDSTLNTQLAHGTPASAMSSDQCDASFESAVGEDFPYGLDEPPSPEVIHGLTQGLYPKGFPVELVATPMPVRALPFSPSTSKSAGNLHRLGATESNQSQQNGIQIDYENTARRGSSGSRMSERDLDNSENGSGTRLSASSRYRCAHPGCKRSWEKWHSLKDLRRMAHSHYCGSCQQSYCGHHTRVRYALFTSRQSAFYLPLRYFLLC